MNEKQIAALLERIEQIRAEASTFVDAKAEELKKDHPTLPLPVLRNLLAGNACPCAQALKVAGKK